MTLPVLEMETLHSIPFRLSDESLFFTGLMPLPDGHLLQVIGVQNPETEETFVLDVALFEEFLDVYMKSREAMLGEKH